MKGGVVTLSRRDTNYIRSNSNPIPNEAHFLCHLFAVHKRTVGAVFILDFEREHPAGFEGDGAVLRGTLRVVERCYVLFGPAKSGAREKRY